MTKGVPWPPSFARAVGPPTQNCFPQHEAATKVTESRTSGTLGRPDHQNLCNDSQPAHRRPQGTGARRARLPPECRPRSATALGSGAPGPQPQRAHGRPTGSAGYAKPPPETASCTRPPSGCQPSRAGSPTTSPQTSPSRRHQRLAPTARPPTTTRPPRYPAPVRGTGLTGSPARATPAPRHPLPSRPQALPADRPPTATAPRCPPPRHPPSPEASPMPAAGQRAGSP